MYECSVMYDIPRIEPMQLSKLSGCSMSLDMRGNRLALLTDGKVCAASAVGTVSAEGTISATGAASAVGTFSAVGTADSVVEDRMG